MLKFFKDSKSGGKPCGFESHHRYQESIAKLCLLFCKLVGLEKEGLSFVSVKADTKLKTKIVLWTIFTTRPEGELPPSVQMTFLFELIEQVDTKINQ